MPTTKTVTISQMDTMRSLLTINQEKGCQMNRVHLDEFGHILFYDENDRYCHIDRHGNLFHTVLTLTRTLESELRDQFDSIIQDS